jgi:hypothetical protein
MRSGKGLLTPLQRRFIAQFAGLADQERFYLAGGTALAEYYLGHRLSFDLDFFTGEEGLVLPFSRSVEGLARDGGFTVTVARRFATYVEFEVADGDDRLKVDLAQDSPFRLAAPRPSDSGIRVGDLADLRIDKLLAYYGRAEPRDAVDLFFLLPQAPLDELLAQAAQKDPGFDLYWFAVALNRAADFPDEAARWPVKMLLPLDARALKAHFASLAQHILGRLASQ